MSSDWPLLKLKDVGVSLIDCDHKTPKAQEVGFPYIGIPQIKDGRISLEGARLISEEDFHQWRRKSKPIPNDIILSRRCNPGETAFVPENLEIALGQNLVLLRSDANSLYPPFLRWVVQGPQWWDQVGKFINVGAIFNSLKCADIPQFEIRVPPPKVQEKIADILGSLDKKIELNRQTNQTLEQIAQALFKSWFVDFEPTRAKIAAKEAGASPGEIERAAMCAISGKTPDQLAQLPPETQQNLKTTAALFPDALVDSELGEVPEGWFVKQLSELGNIVCGKTPPKDNLEYYGGNIPFIKIPDMHGKLYATKTSDTLTHSGANTQIKKLLPKDSVCVSCIATVGLVSLTCVNSFTNQQINTIVPNNKNNSQYIYFAMLGLNEHLHDLASGGSATLNLNTGHFSKIKIVLPGESILENFANQVRPKFDLILQQSFEIDSLERVRDSLLPKLLSGEISLLDATKELV